jgi:hypothetical protein
MTNFRKTNRHFKNCETGDICDLWMDDITHEYKLIHQGSEQTAKGSEVNGFYIAAHSSITIKINRKKIVSISRGEYYNLKEFEQITHKKYCGFKSFTKI